LIVAVVAFIFGLSNYMYKTTYYTVAGIAFLLYILLLIRKPHYFGLYDEKDHFVVRYYNPHPFFSNYKQVKIKKNEYDGYKIKNNLFGFQKSVIFYIRQGNKKGQYPPISISGLNKQQRKQLEEYLENL